MRMVAEIRAEHESEWAAMTPGRGAARGRDAGDGPQVGAGRPRSTPARGRGPRRGVGGGEAAEAGER